jgi:hypothetical protein
MAPEVRARQVARPPQGQTAAILAVLLLASACSSDDAQSSLQGQTGSARYALDGVPRKLPRGDCPPISVREFSGETLRFLPAARIAGAFRSHLAQFEDVVRDVALDIYGRAPSAVLVAASYDCRSVRGKQGRLSEHALGNAIDIKGFRFPPVPGSWLHSAQEGFEVRVDQHWHARWGWKERKHARFLETLTQELIERDVFRTLLGPAHPDHKDHFHFDMAPGHFVDL